MMPVVEVAVEEPAHVGAARRAVAGLVPDDAPDLADTVRLTVSEVVTNAMVHGRPPVTVRAFVHDRVLRVEVCDASADRGVPQQASAAASGGRGLAIVHAIAHRWGIEARGAGKAVWLEFSLATDSTAVEAVVHLRGVPVDTYLRSQEHLESTLHELQVLAASDAGAFSAVESTTLVPLRQAMEVFRGVRTRGRAEAEAAASGGQASLDFTWPLPPQAAAAARVYGEGVAELDRLAGTGVLLTPPADPEIARFRRWLCREIAAQLDAGATPTPFA
ncbi:MAG: ATP-binding protein [Actinobacteria bacterium]|nr:ATP-binding protein [Actinomycetota bacterium]